MKNRNKVIIRRAYRKLKKLMTELGAGAAYAIKR